MATVQIDLRRLGPADWVTTVRLLLSCVVAGLVVVALAGAGAVRPSIVVLAAVALVLDLVDGQVARRTGTASAAGARYDMEVDAFLILVLSVYAAVTAAPWALLIGAARYLLLVASWRWAWLRAPVPPRYWAKVVAAVQGVVLVTVVSGLLPHRVALLLLAVALVLLAESFGHQIHQLRVAHVARRRAARPEQAAAARARPILSAAVTPTAYAIVWAALALPDHPGGLAPAVLVQMPVELLALVAASVVLPSAPRRILCVGFGLAVALLGVVKALDIGFVAVLSRRFDLLNDPHLLGSGLGVLRDTNGSLVATVAAIGAALAALGILVALPLAADRIGTSTARHRRIAIHAVGILGLGWLVGSAIGLRVGPVPVAAAGTSEFAAGQIRLLRHDVADRPVFARELAHDRFAGTPASRLLTGLRGKDVIVAFVESYGRVAVQGSTYSSEVDRVLDRGTRRLAAAGYSARSAFLTSPTFGAESWLAHSTLESGTWVDSEQRYGQLLGSHRLTLAAAFHQAGWRTVFDIPSVTRSWSAGQRFYGFDKLYDAHNVGYRGPRFGYATMPDQYTWAAFRRDELEPPDRRPVMAEIDLVSSHHPWTPLPRLVPWGAVGDGSVFDGMPAGQPSADEVLGDATRVRAAYGASVVYTLRTLISFVEHDRDPNLVLVVLGDHQPHSYVSGSHPGHDVPVSVIARDPRVIHRINGWGWQDGLRPAPDAPVWRMNAFRDRFLTAFGPSGHERPLKGATP